MSPEQAEGLKVDARSDIFSFGALLYEMVTGRRAFHGETPMSTITAILRDQPTPIASDHPDVPRELERIIVRCLRKDPDRRYQTMTDVRLALEELKEDVERAPGVELHSPGRRRRAYVWPLVGLVLASASVAWVMWNRKPAVPEAPTIIKPFTNNGGFEGSPAVSPDGKMIAFAWNGDQLDTMDIYVKLLDSSQPLKLTSGPEAKMWPVWSPDGRRIAYTSPVGDVGRQVYEIPALGGHPRRITEGWATDWSPDGHSLLVIRHTTSESSGGVFLVSVADGSTRRLTTFASGHLQDSAKFSADGASVLFTEVESANRSRIMRLPVAGGETQPVQISGLRQADMRTLLPGGREILVAGLREGGGQLALFRVPLEGGAPSELPYGGAAARPGLAALVRAGVSAARTAPTLAFVEFTSNVNVWRVAAWPGGERKPERWIASEREEFSAAASPDGSRIAVASTRSGFAQISGRRRDQKRAERDLDLRWHRGITAVVTRWDPDCLRRARRREPRHLGCLVARRHASTVDERKRRGCRARLVFGWQVGVFHLGSYRTSGGLEGSRHWRHGAAGHARRRLQRAALGQRRCLLLEEPRSRRASAMPCRGRQGRANRPGVQEQELRRVERRHLRSGWR